MKKVASKTKCPQAVEEFLSAEYAGTRVTSRGATAPTEVTRCVSPMPAVDRLRFDCELDFDFAGMPLLGLLAVHEGTYTTGRGPDTAPHGPGSVTLPAPPGGAVSGSLAHCAQTAVLLAPALVNRMAGIDEDGPSPLTGVRPRSPEAEARLYSAVGYLGQLADYDALEQGRTARSAAEHLAALLLDCFADGRGPRPTGAPTSTHQGTLRKAIDFIEAHATLDVGLAEIAAAADVTPRAVRYAFARHTGTTPHVYLRNARLDRSHGELVRARPGDRTVAEIAAKWGSPTRAASPPCTGSGSA
ncbi:AraC family transcriptional regulator [Streptomyces sp. NPDC097619]|uniref:AraC family transcriptional regulator n=1 Tax=Streptomyces sp. NPDC097619 TaxID=3157228 RepID=UPI00331EAE71